MREPIEVVRDFCAAWARLDVDEIMSFFGDDPVYHNMPGPPTVGRDAIRTGISRFLGGWSATTFDILNIAAAGNIVLAERVDRIDSNGKHLDLPVTGVFEIADGKIKTWRDYFDLATYTRTLS